MYKSLIILFILLTIFSSISAQEMKAKEKIYISMEEAISRALSKNNQVKASEFGMLKANWDKKQAWTQLFPTVSLNTRYMKIDQKSFEERDFFRQNLHLFFPNLPPDFTVPQSSYRESFYTSIDLAMPIFNGNIFNGLYIANAAEEASIQMNESTKRNIVFLVTQVLLKCA